MSPTLGRILLTLAAAASAACAPTSPNFDQNFGASTRILNAQQVYNPNAPVANRDNFHCFSAHVRDNGVWPAPTGEGQALSPAIRRFITPLCARAPV